jgi:hypothetical protein
VGCRLRSFLRACLSRGRCRYPLTLRSRGWVSLYPGHVRTEGVMKGIPEDKLPFSESPIYVGRAVPALAADPRRIKKTGKILLAGEMAKEYGFKDIDGTRPNPTHTVKIGKQFNKTAFERLRKPIE